MKFYRYEIGTYGYADDVWPQVRVELKTYVLLRETEQGYWIVPESMKRHPEHLERVKRWVSKTSRSRRAYPTKEEAMMNFKARTKRRIGILQYQIKVCREALSRAEVQEQLKQEK